jgi:PAS domain-containing protein
LKDGKLSGSVLEVQDVTEEKQAEQGLRETDEQVRHTLEFNQAVMANMGEGLYTLDSRGLVTYMNPAAGSSSGWSVPNYWATKMHEHDSLPISGWQAFHADDALGYKFYQKELSYRITRRIYP